MTTLFAVNENNDIFATASNRLALATGLDATLQHAEHVVKARRGEMIYVQERGINYLSNVFGNFPNLLQFEAEVRAAISRVPDVLSILDFEADIINNELRYTIEIQTPFGAGTVTNQ